MFEGYLFGAHWWDWTFMMLTMVILAASPFTPRYLRIVFGVLTIPAIFMALAMVG